MRPRSDHSFLDLHEKARLALTDPRLVVIAIKADSPNSAENTAARQEFPKPQQLAVAALVRLKKRFPEAFWDLPETEATFTTLSPMEKNYLHPNVVHRDRTARGGNAMLDEHLPFADMFENEPNGLIYCRLVHGSDGQPSDFVYLAANRAFRMMIGVDVVVGKRGSSINTGISAFDGAHHNFRRVCETGRPERFDMTVDSTGDIVLASVASPKQDIFTASFSVITERRKLERSLKESERKYREMFEGSSDAMMLNTADAFIDCNKATLAMFGYTREEFIGKHPGDVSPPHQPGGQESRVSANHCIQAAFRDGKNFFDWIHRRKDGSDFPAEVLLTPVSVGGQLVIQASVRDISERRELEIKAHERKIALKRSQSLAHVGSWSYDVRTKTFSWSDEMLRIFGIDAYMSGNDAYEVIKASVHPHDRQKVIDLHAVLNKTEIPATIEYRIFRSDGTMRHIRATSDKPHLGDSETVMKYSGIVQDVTDMKWNEERYKTILNTTMDGFWMVDDEGRIIEANDSYCRMSGYTREELVGITVASLEVIESPEDIKKRIENILRSGHARFEAKHRAKDGRCFDIEVSVTLIPESTGTMIVFIHDITARKHAASEQMKMQRLEALGVLAGGIAHDFNNLLTGIVGNASLAATETEEDMRHALKEIVSVGRRATGITQQLLTFAKGGTPSTRVISLTDLIIETAQFTVGKSSACECVFAIPSNLWHAEVDSGQIAQVIQNLVINAKQAMADGGTITISGENVDHDAASNSGPYVSITVSDTGCGIPAKYLSRIFDPYFTTKSRDGTGSGLGLAVVHSVVTKHRGHISVESSEQGTSFRMLFPAIIVQRSASAPKIAQVAPIVSHKILVMDDEAVIRRVLQRMLRAAGQEVVLVENGNQAAEEFAKAFAADEPFDAAFLDMTIPGGMGGGETMKRLRSIDPSIIIVISSGYSDQTLTGVDAYLSKPYSLDDLRMVVRTLFPAYS
jgi:PAS domain S-box-containing protein